MVFNIRKGATLPILKMEVIKDGRIDYEKLQSYLTSSTITFSMKESRSNIYKVVNVPANIYMKDPCVEDGLKEYYIGYQFTSDDTDTEGIYIGQFKLNIFDETNVLIGELVAPIKEDLYIYITETFVKSDIINNI